MQKKIKEWSILIYANGNNELEPEIYQAKSAAETVGSDEHVNVIMQIGREDRNLAKLLRPFESLPECTEKWTGVRRYLIKFHGSELLETLGNINMADAATLYHFIVWAADNFPAKHYLLILGGHGYQFVGCMTDYSGNIPYIMGIPELCKAIDLACFSAGIKIDLLLMDTCYFNFIEVLYELGKIPGHGVQYMITYIINGPLTGFPYDQLIPIVQDNCRVASIEYLIKQLIESFSSDLVAFRINHDALKIIKNLFNDLAKIYITSSEENKIGLPQLFLPHDKPMPFQGVVTEITSNVNALITYYKRTSANQFPLINVANKPAKDREAIQFYHKLSFSFDNYWTHLLYNMDKSFLTNRVNHLTLQPVIMPPKAVYAYISIMNPLQPSEYKKQIFENLLHFKNWKL